MLALPVPHSPPNALVLAVNVMTGLPSGSRARSGPTYMPQDALTQLAGGRGGSTALRSVTVTVGPIDHCPEALVQSPVQRTYDDVNRSSIGMKGCPAPSSTRP